MPGVHVAPPSGTACAARAGAWEVRDRQRWQKLTRALSLNLAAVRALCFFGTFGRKHLGTCGCVGAANHHAAYRRVCMCACVHVGMWACGPVGAFTVICCGAVHYTIASNEVWDGDHTESFVCASIDCSTAVQRVIGEAACRSNAADTRWRGVCVVSWVVWGCVRAYWYLYGKTHE